ncbi:hypothetical protein CAPTEDRAFT_194896 [Capitella teleta]|uniref:Retrotransposon gag domain-containing protein n=1 Tax=Capitella teleta TaxID=283909 RepID=R7TTW4_CAPTE|nr:hypothetical protein CAPTEDRAFT_194896 [Capitella teleta]|eukprot:ELT94455.1 hypothetical protein CAPTEDRAFT_194896 [Capitella teleta]
MLELMAVLGQRGVASGGPETLPQSSAAPPRKPLKSTKVDNDTFFQDHFAPEQGTGMMGSDAELLNTIEKRQNRPPRSTLKPPAMNVNRERDVSWGKPLPTWTAAGLLTLQPIRMIGALLSLFEGRRRQQRNRIHLLLILGCGNSPGSRLPPHRRCSYALLKEKLLTRFNVVQAPAVLRKQLQDVRQGMEESRQEFASRVQQLARDAHPSLVTEAVEPMAVDAFLRGCKEKLAAYSVLN